MVQARGAASGGTANKAIKSVPLGERASPEEYADLVAFMRGKSQVTVQTKRGILAQGWAPGRRDERIPADHRASHRRRRPASPHRGLHAGRRDLGAVRGRRHTRCR